MFSNKLWRTSKTWQSGTRNDGEAEKRPGLLASCPTTLTVLVVVVAAMLPVTARAALQISEVQLLVFHNRTDDVSLGLTFEVELTGQEMGVVTVTPPGKSAITIPGGATERRYRSKSYADLAALQLDFPPSGEEKYEIEINGATTLSLDFAPTMPNGVGFFVSPTHGSATTDTMPTLVVDNSACANCNVQVVNLEEFAQDGINSELFEFDPFSTSIEIADLSPPLDELIVAEYEACLSMAVGTIEDDFMNGGLSFELVRAGVDENCVEFNVVPVPNVQEVDMWVGESKQAGVVDGWSYEVYVIGTDLVAGTVTPPGGAPLDLDTSVPGELGFLGGPFESLESLQAAFPPSNGSKYVISLNGGVATVALDFDPIVPNGGLTVTSPSQGDTVGSRPSFTVANSCGNCEGQYAEINDGITDGEEVFVTHDVGPPFPVTINFSDFGPNQGSGGSVADGLPEGPYALFAEAYNEAWTDESFVPSDDFEYWASAYREDGILFLVPEPASQLLQLGALFVLTAWSRRRHESLVTGRPCRLRVLPESRLASRGTPRS